MKFNLTLTDTFGGEANYSWVKRETIEVKPNASNLSIVRKAKKVMGLNGMRSKVSDYGDTITIHPYGHCVVLFIDIVN